MQFRALMCAISMAMLIPITGCATMENHEARERLSLNADWRFQKDDPPDSKTDLTYRDIKQWVMATGNEFLKAAAATTQPSRPEGNLGEDVAYTKADFNDSTWRQLNLPHDWGIEGPFKQEYPGDTGKLPWWGKAWYRKHFTIGPEDKGKQIYLDVDGAMAYAMVWLNGQYVGGWPYGYASWRVDLTPYIKVGGENVLAIRLDVRRDLLAGIWRSIETSGWSKPSTAWWAMGTPVRRRRSRMTRPRSISKRRSTIAGRPTPRRS